MAKKKLSRDQKRKQKKQKRRNLPRKLDSFDKLIGRVEGLGLDNYKFLRNPAGLDKMSDVLMAFIEPYKEFADDIDQMHRLMMPALVAWNCALMDKAEQKKSIQAVSQKLPADAVEDFEAIVAEMIERKNTYFAAYTRHIIDYELEDLGHSYHISVISTINPEEVDDG